MGTRFSEMVKSMQRWLVELFEPAEDPRLSFGYTYQHQYELLVRVRQALASTNLGHERLAAKQAEVRDILTTYERRAAESLDEGRDDMARIELYARRVSISQLQEIETQIAELEREEKRLHVMEQHLIAQIEAHMSRQQLIEVRQSATEAKIHIRRELEKVSQELSDLDAQLEETEHRAERVQREADRLDEALATHTDLLPASLPPDFAGSGVAQTIESDLEAFKQDRLRR